MRKTARVVAALALAGVAGGACSSASGPTTGASSTATTAAGPASSVPAVTGTAGWTTYFHDSGRRGVAPDGPPSPAAVHRQWLSPALDGDVYAEPLVVGDEVIVVTENDTVYALSTTTGAVGWRRHLGTPVPSSSLPCGNVDPVGITSTPVADAGSGRLYVVGLVQPARHMLFALDLATGAVVASTGIDAPGADPSTHNQRGALTLDGGRILVPFGGRYGDCGTYHGRLASVPVSASGLGAPAWYTLPSGREGGFWEPAGPVVAPDGTIYLTSGNTAGAASYDYGNSVLHLSAALKLMDSFAPTDWAALNSTDSDLGSTNPVLVGDNRVFQIGKAGIGYLLDAGHLGGMGGQLATATVCPGPALGAVSHMGSDLFVPCRDGVADVDVSGDLVNVKWRSRTATPGPAIVTSAAVWTVATGSGQLVALDPTNGRTVSSQAIGDVPSQFTTPSAGSGRIVVAAGRKVSALAD